MVQVPGKLKNAGEESLTLFSASIVLVTLKYFSPTVIDRLCDVAEGKEGITNYYKIL